MPEQLDEQDIDPWTNQASQFKAKRNVGKVRDDHSQQLSVVYHDLTGVPGCWFNLGLRFRQGCEPRGFQEQACYWFVDPYCSSLRFQILVRGLPRKISASSA